MTDNSTKKPTPKKRSAIYRFIIKPILIVVVGFHLLVFILLFIGKTMPVTYSAFMLAHQLQGGEIHHTWVDYNAIAKSTKQAAIASEDAKFATHNGFDIEGIELAIKANEQAGGISMGGSTISQQLAKNLFLTSHRSYIRKGEEAIITVMMEKLWSKQRILEVYLNVVEFGQGIYGIEAAAQHYFQKPASQLTKEQSALLISLLPNPKYYQTNLNNKRLQNKKRIIMKRMSSADLP